MTFKHFTAIYFSVVVLAGCARGPDPQLARFEERRQINNDLVQLSQKYIAATDDLFKAIINGVRKEGCKAGYLAAFEKSETEAAKKMESDMREIEPQIKNPSGNPDDAAYVAARLPQITDTLRVVKRAKLDLADAALAKGCLEIADAQYRMVLKAGGAEFERRAEVGIADIRAKRASNKQ
jgi:hypothetical protein